MKVTYERCAGADVHKDVVVVCVVVGSAGERPKKEVKSFGTTTSELLKLSDWLASYEVTHIAVESTGVYWKPLFNILDGTFEVWLVNARHVKAVPGRKTDVRDSEWLTDLMRHGLLRRSFIPPMEIREFRELTRYRRCLIRNRSQESNRIQKLLEDANVKLGSVVTDVLGVSGLEMLWALVDGEKDTSKLADMARGRMHSKKSELKEALNGRLKEHHRMVLRELLRHVEHLDKAVARLDREIKKRLRDQDTDIERLDEIPGIDRRTIEDVLAEIGTDMTRFPTSAHLASWAGVCPGNNESAGKRLSGKTRKGSPWLRGALVQAAWAASRTKKSYYRAKFQRIKSRRGVKKALVAIAHALLVTIYEMLRQNKPYKDLGPDYFDRLDRTARARRLVMRLNELGYKVNLPEPA